MHGFRCTRHPLCTSVPTILIKILGPAGRHETFRTPLTAPTRSPHRAPGPSVDTGPAEASFVVGSEHDFAGVGNGTPGNLGTRCRGQELDEGAPRLLGTPRRQHGFAGFMGSAPGEARAILSSSAGDARLVGRRAAGARRERGVSAGAGRGGGLAPRGVMEGAAAAAAAARAELVCGPSDDGGGRARVRVCGRLRRGARPRALPPRLRPPERGLSGRLSGGRSGRMRMRGGGCCRSRSDQSSDTTAAATMGATAA